MRIFFPASMQNIVELSGKQAIMVQRGFVITPEFAADQDEQDVEVLEDAVLYCAGAASLEQTQGDDARSSRLVIVADVPEQDIHIVDAKQGSAEFIGETSMSWQRVVALFADDVHGQEVIAGGGDPSDVSMMWFGPTEAQTLLESLGFSTA